jgi:cell wall-associated NlpC family hydrolase
MRRNWLARTVLTAAAISVPMAGVVQAAQAAPQSSSQQKAVAHTVNHNNKKPARHRRRYESFDTKVATYAKRFIGVPYVYGGTSPAGFDCSGLTQYVYRHFGKRIQRIAEDQFLQFRRISKARAWGGDLVFFHESSDPNSYVYHVGIYEGGNSMVAATTYGSGVEWQSFAWAGNTVTFGTITH